MHVKVSKLMYAVDTWNHALIEYLFLFFIYFLFLSDEGPMLETLDYTIRIGSDLK